ALDTGFVTGQALELLLERLVFEDGSIGIVTGAHRDFKAAHAAKLPGGGDDFGGERFFDGAFGAEVELKVFGHLVELFLVFGSDEIFFGAETMGMRIRGGSRFAFWSLRASAKLRVGLISCLLF